MQVNLLHATPLYIAIRAIRECYDSMDKSDSIDKCIYAEGECLKDKCDLEAWECYGSTKEIGEKDKELLKKIIKSDHTSTLEHISFTFSIEGISRACLQELARHRMASLSVQSTRYTLKKILCKEVAADDYFVHTGIPYIDERVKEMILDIPVLAQGAANDTLKYMLPEAFKTSLIWTINARSLRNFLQLRTSPRALWEIREMAEKVKGAVGMEEYQMLFEDIMNDENASLR